MKVIGLDNREYSWKLAGHQPLKNDSRPRSKFHKRARNLLEALFPCDGRLEEVYLPGSDGLYADFYLPTRGLIVEVHGRQHFEFVMHFHQTKLGFLKSKQRDQTKRDWCELNEIRLVELDYRESDDEWRKRILERDRRPAETDCEVAHDD